MGRQGWMLLSVASAALWHQAESKFNDNWQIPLTVVKPAGNEDTLHLHMAAFGSIPYGEVMGRTDLLQYPDGCTCGDFPCKSGCGSLVDAPPECKPAIRPNGFNMFLLEEEDDTGCKRSERVYNAAKAGARAVAFIAAPNATHLTAGVSSNSVSAEIETLQYLEHVNVPVGIMKNGEGQTLKDIAKTGDTVVKLDFSHQEHGQSVMVNVWHDTDDDCGVLCHHVHEFFAELASIEDRLPAGGPITIVPRFLYQTCTGDDSDTPRCKRGCINNGQYCTLRGSRSAQAPGAMVTQENVRQACLYDALRDNASNVRQFWRYKVNFQNNCKSRDQTFNAKCSGDQFRTLNLQHADVVRARWENCTAAISRGASSIRVADDDITGMTNQGISTFLQATVVTVLPQPKPSHHFRGELSAVHVIKAACSALDPTARAKVPTCERVMKGHCRPGGPGDQACRSIANQDKRTTMCVDTVSELGYTCECAPGYAQISNVDGRRECADRNECAEFPTLCGRLVNRRNACRNTEGSFECIEDLPQECSEDNNWSDCWSGSAHGRRYHSCEDMVGQVRYNLQMGLDRGPLSRCNCEFIKGCWAGGTGDCRERCPFDSCNVETGQCDNETSSLSTGGILGISFAVVAAVALALAVAFLAMRRRKLNHDPAKGVVSHYDNFRDGMDADEMARSGTVEMYVAGAAANSDGVPGSVKGRQGGVVPPPNGGYEGDRPPTFGAQNSFVGSLTIEEQESRPPAPQ